MQFKPAPGLSVETLSENGREIYDDLVAATVCRSYSMNVEEASNDNPHPLLSGRQMELSSPSAKSDGGRSGTKPS